MAELLRGDFLMVNKECDPFTSEISINDAEALRETLIDDFYEEVSPRRVALNENFNKTIAAKSFSHVPMFDIETPSKFVGTILNNYTDIGSWGLTIVSSQYCRSPENTSPIRIEKHLVVEARDQEIVEAHRRLLVTRTLGALSVDDVYNGISDDEPTGSESLRRQKLAFTRYATVDDIVDAIDLLERTAKQTKRIEHIKERRARAGITIGTARY